MRLKYPVILLSVSSGCGLFDRVIPAPPPPPPEVAWVKPAVPVEQAKSNLESAQLVANKGSFTVSFPAGKGMIRCTIGLDQVSLRVGDLPSLTHIMGHVKLNPSDMQCGDPSNDTVVHAIVENIFTSMGAPIQVFYDVGSIAHVVGRLQAQGDKATGAVIGELQVNDHKADLDLVMGAQRLADQSLTITIPETTLDITQFGLESHMVRLAKALHYPNLPTKVSFEGEFTLVAFHGTTMPSFIRVPVTVNRASDFAKRIDAAIDDDVVARRKLTMLGFPAAYVDKIGADEAKASNKLKSYYNRHNDVNFDAQAARSGTTVAGGNE